LTTKDVIAASRAIGVEIQLLKASSDDEIARLALTGTHLGRKLTEDTKDGSRKTVLAMRAKGFGYRKIAREA
jgi:hypothetical protein